MNNDMMKKALYKGVWGTIGPRFKEACQALAQKSNGAFGILMHSKTAAYETALRSLGICHGTAVLCSSSCDKMDSEVAVAIGAQPLFMKAISAEIAKDMLQNHSGIKALVLDFSEEVNLEAIKEVCLEHNCALILNAGNDLSLTLDYQGLYAVIFDLGICGGAVTNSEETYNLLFAYHHCGHAPGTAASISFGGIVGGDMRVSEFQAIEAMEILKESR